MLEFTGERFIPTKELMNDEMGFEHLHRYNCIIPFIRNKIVLDIACGEGYGTALIGKYAQKAYGVDIDESCIQWASARYGAIDNKLAFKKGAIENIPLQDGSVDVIISFETIEHVNVDAQQLFAYEIKRVLKKDGLLIISTPNTDIYTGKHHVHNQFHVKEFQKEELHSFLKAHFKYIYPFEQGYEIVSAITGNNIKDLTRLQVCNWDRKLKDVNRRYLICIASDKEVTDYNNLSSIVFQVNKELIQTTNHNTSLKKNDLINQKTDLPKEAIIEAYEKQLASLHERLALLKSEINEHITNVEQASELLNEKENIIADQNHRIATIYQEADQINNRLAEIYSSEGWKLLSVYYRLKARILPPGSKRYNKIKKIFNKLRNKKNDDYVITDYSEQLKKEAEVEITSFDIIEFPAYEKPKVSIIIPAYNGWQMNYQCLHSIKNNTYGITYEVIFADDVSTDETKDIENYIKNITVVRNETNQGFLKNCNHAATFARGEYIHFLNNDTKVTRGWLTSLVELMKKDPAIGMAGSKLVYPDGRLQEAGGIIWKDASAWNFGHKQNPDAPEFNYVKEVDYISGASILIRKEVWDKLGGFDEAYVPAYCEDSDFAFKIRKMNMKVVYQPLSEVVHYEGFSHGTDQNKNSGLTNTKQYQEINKKKFAATWNQELQQQLPNGVNVFHARDRSYGKKTILVIDHYVPQFDKDAGSRTTYQYLEAFTELGMNVKFMGDNFYKYEPYSTILQQKGIEVIYGSYYAKNYQKWLLENEKNFDYILLNRPHISEKYIKLLQNRTHAKIFYYGHDLHFIRELKEYEITKDEKKLSSSNRWKTIEYNLFRNSDVVLTPTLKEKEIISKDFRDKKIEVLPAFFYEEIAKPITNFNERKNLLFVGGFKHSPNIDAVIWFVEEVLPIVRKQIPEIQFIVTGSNVPERIAKFASENVIIKGFVSDKELDRLYNTCKIAVIPLRFGAGLKGKTVEAMAKGLPVVSTSFGIEGLNDLGDLLQPYDTAQEFANAVTALYNNTNALEKLSERTAAYSGNHFTKKAAKEFFKSLFQLK